MLSTSGLRLSAFTFVLLLLLIALYGPRNIFNNKDCQNMLWAMPNNYYIHYAIIIITKFSHHKFLLPLHPNKLIH